MKRALKKWSSDPTIPVSGPYCYNNNVEGAYFFDIMYSSSNANATSGRVNFDTGCASNDTKGCYPEFLARPGGEVEIHDKSTNSDVSISLALPMYLLGVCLILALVSCTMGVWVVKVKRALKRLVIESNGLQSEGFMEYEQREGEDEYEYDRLAEGEEGGERQENDVS